MTAILDEILLERNLAGALSKVVFTLWFKLSRRFMIRPEIMNRCFGLELVRDQAALDVSEFASSWVSLHESVTARWDSA